MLLRSLACGLLLLPVTLGGCGSEGDGDGEQQSASSGGGVCESQILGDAAKDIEMVVTTCGADIVSSDLAPGARVPMIRPPQAGKVVLIGVRATNLDLCAAQLSAAVRDTTTNQVRLDARTINLLPTGDGWGTSTDGDMSTFANVPLCPNQWASTAVDEEPFELVVELTDNTGRVAKATVPIIPFCSEPENAAECECECQQDYMLGQVCE